jgi:hypothetical protein
MDHGPHSHVCADADGGVCHCDCRGRRHGVRHVPGGRVEHDPERDVRISRIHKPGGGYRVVDRETGLPPGGGTQAERDAAGRERVTDKPETREQRIARRAAEVTSRTQDDLDGTPRLSNDLKARVERARKSLPSDKKGWMQPIDGKAAHIAKLRRYLDDSKKALEEAKQRKRDALAEQAERHRNSNLTAQDRAEYARELAEQHDDWIARAQKNVDGNERYLQQGIDSPYDSFEYPKNAKGEIVAPPEWKAHLKTVMDVGRDVLDEHRKGLARDPEYKRLQAEAERLEAAETDARRALFDHVMPAGVDYQAWRKARNAKVDSHPELKRQAREARAAVAKHDQGRLMAMLRSHREFGGAEHKLELLDADRPVPGVTPGNLGSVEGKARSDAEAMMRETEQFYPKAWIELSAARATLRVGTSDRAFYQDSAHFLAQPTEKGTYSAYTGAHGVGDRAGSLDVSIHELGHRMEKSVPGLTQLEMTFVHQRSTASDGTLETPRQLDGYSEREIAYHDTWARAYAGKTYESFNPGTAAWEVFQVGTQDTFGRMNEFDKSDDLQQFVIGALLTL